MTGSSKEKTFGVILWFLHIKSLHRLLNGKIKDLVVEKKSIIFTEWFI